VDERHAGLIRHGASVSTCSHDDVCYQWRVLLKRASALMVAAALAAAPATAFADGAGDQQYQDPLTAPSTPKKAKKKQAIAPVAATPTTTTPAAATAPAAATGTTAAAPAAAQLPRTGAPAGLIALLGALMLAAGLTLRRRTTSA
jgi:LPXTG-motif cell wall-anchored protein